MFEYFRDTDNDLSFITLPYGDDDILHGLRDWVDWLGFDKAEARKIMKDRRIPDDLVEVILKNQVQT